MYALLKEYDPVRWNNFERAGWNKHWSHYSGFRIPFFPFSFPTLSLLQFQMLHAAVFYESWCKIQWKWRAFPAGGGQYRTDENNDPPLISAPRPNWCPKQPNLITPWKKLESQKVSDNKHPTAAFGGRGKFWLFWTSFLVEKLQKWTPPKARRIF